MLHRSQLKIYLQIKLKVVERGLGWRKIVLFSSPSTSKTSFSIYFKQNLRYFYLRMRYTAFSDEDIAATLVSLKMLLDFFVNAEEPM